MVDQRKIKVLISKIGLDGHDRGAKVVASLLREAGMEVVYLGPFHTPEEIVQAALQEDVDVVGLSCLCGEHLTHAPEVARLLKEKGLKNVLCIVGGVIPWEDIPEVKAKGVDEVFPAGTLMEKMVEYLRQNAGRKPRRGVR